MAMRINKRPGQSKQFRVVYEIDVVANSEVEAAVQAYLSMIDPATMAPCLEVIPWHGETPSAEELRGIVVDVNEHYDAIEW